MDPFLGQIMLCGFAFPPRGWADCNGQLLPVRAYPTLFSLLGTRFGGDGTGTFGLPDLQGRVAVSQGASPGGTAYTLGQRAGSAAVAVTAGSMAAHAHGLMAGPVAQPGTGSGTAIGNGFATLPSGRGTSGHMYAPAPATTVMGPVVQPVGGGLAHPNLQPFLALRYVIALVGIVPQRP